MKVFYWSPFLSNIATVDAVSKSINSIKNYDKEKIIEPYIIDATGEWKKIKSTKTKNINFKKLYDKSLYNYLPKGSYFKSRISQILIFILSFFSLKKLLKKENPNFLIAHLIISLPLLLFSIFDFKTKLIIRISGTPKLNFIRRFFWSILSTNVYKVTCPTFSTYNKLVNLKIFPANKIEILFDPVLSIKEIIIKKKEPIDKRFEKEKFILGIGRLSRQKNFELLIRAFGQIALNDQEIKLLIIGEGEERAKLQKLIKDLKLKEKAFLLGYKQNIFNYLDKAMCFVCSSFYEDPGFVLIEAAFLNKIVFAADSNTGPSEILDNSSRGFLFRNNNHGDLVKKYNEFNQFEIKHWDTKRLKLKKYSKKFSLFQHYSNLNKILLKQ